MDSDDDEFLYGPSKNDTQRAASSSKTPPLSAPKPIHLDQIRSDSNGVVAQLEDEIFGNHQTVAQPEVVENGDAEADAEDDAQAEEAEEEEESDDDIEIIMEPTSRSLDLRQGRASSNRASATYAQPKPVPPSQVPSLTTEYTPRERGGSARQQPQQSSHQPQQPQQQQKEQQQQQQQQQQTISSHDSDSHKLPSESESRLQNDDGPDPNSFPPAIAPPSHPPIDPTAVGTLDGRSILEMDLNALTEKSWRRPGSDISDWFNYGFDEVSWEAYCYRRKEVGDVANVLKANVVNYAGMPEEQITALPPEIRSMVMASATTFMSGGGANAGMMPTNVGIPMMGEMGMNMPQMGMMNGMNGDMSGMQMGVPMQDGGNGGVVPGQIQQEAGGGDGFVGPSATMMGMMGGDYAMQDPTVMQQQMYSSMDGGNTPVQAQVRPVPAAPFRGRGQSMGLRGRGGGFQGRGGRGPQVIPVRSASPLPPNVPTGPRNQNKYKDRDGNAAGVDGLDYGGGRDVNSGTPPEERSRKRRGSPVIDDARSKRR